VRKPSRATAILRWWCVALPKSSIAVVQARPTGRPVVCGMNPRGRYDPWRRTGRHTAESKLSKLHSLSPLSGGGSSGASRASASRIGRLSARRRVPLDVPSRAIPSARMCSQPTTSLRVYRRIIPRASSPVRVRGRARGVGLCGAGPVKVHMRVYTRVYTLSKVEGVRTVPNTVPKRRFASVEKEEATER